MFGSKHSRKASAVVTGAGSGIGEAFAHELARRGGRVVCAGIHMSDIPTFRYADLWGERMIRSVANLTRQDGIEFLDLAPRIPVSTSVTVFPLEEANAALAQLRRGALQGAAVLEMDGA